MHHCREHLDYIGGGTPYECLVCGLRYDACDLQPGGRLADGVTLREASADGRGIVPLSGDALIAAAQRTGFPVPIATEPVTGVGTCDLYDPDELVSWFHRPTS